MNTDFFVSMALSIIFTTLKMVVKSDKSKAAMKAALLKLYLQIKAAYAGDPDFS